MSYTLTDRKYERVLGWVNRQRAKYEIGKPLKRLPRGWAGMAYSCPLATALTGGPVVRAHVSRRVRLCGRSATVAILDVPEYVADFIEAFDEGACSRLRKLRKS